MTGSFTKKIIQVNITVAEGDFGADLGNTAKLTNHRIVCSIQKGGHPSKNQAKIHVYGMSQNLMTQLTKNPFSPLAYRKSFVEVLAGDAETGLHLAFKGNVTDMHASFKTPPNGYLSIEAVEGYYPNLLPSKARSYSGSSPAAGIFAELASEMGFHFEDNGVTSQIRNPYLYGSAMKQASDLANALNLEFGVDDGILFIAPRNKERTGTGPLVSPQSGMKEYPTYTNKGLHVESIYLPTAKLGGVFEIQGSVVSNANGVWRISGLHHQLESENPSGQWSTKLIAPPKTNTKGQPVDSGSEESPS